MANDCRLFSIFPGNERDKKPNYLYEAYSPQTGELIWAESQTLLVLHSRDGELMWAETRILSPFICQTLLVTTSGAANEGGGPPKPHHKFFTDYEKYKTCPVNRKMITGCVFVFVSREAAILAQNALETGGSARTAGGAHSAVPDLGEGRDGRGKRQGKGRARGYIKVRREDVREEKDGEGRKKAKESRVVPHPKLNPGCATGYYA